MAVQKFLRFCVLRICDLQLLVVTEYLLQGYNFISASYLTAPSFNTY